MVHLVVWCLLRGEFSWLEVVL